MASRSQRAIRPGRGAQNLAFVAHGIDCISDSQRDGHAWLVRIALGRNFVLLADKRPNKAEPALAIRAKRDYIARPLSPSEQHPEA
jgi:hypothetical protein